MNANQSPSSGLTTSLSSDLTPHLLATGELGSAAASVPSAIGRIAHGSRGASGEGAVVEFLIQTETDADVPAREALLDRAMGAGRRRKSSEKLRRGRLPAQGLAFVARDASGAVVGTVRLWDVRLGDAGRRALLLGPLAVDPAIKSAGIGSALMRHAVAEARRLGYGAILLVGDAPYYARFGFSADRTGTLSMPGPYERHRFLALELKGGWLDGASGVLVAAGRKVKPEQQRAAA